MDSWFLKIYSTWKEIYGNSFFKIIIDVLSYDGFTYQNSGSAFTHVYQVLTPSTAVTINIVRCYEVINCILHALLPSQWPTLLWLRIIVSLNTLLPPPPKQPSSPFGNP